MSQPNIRTHGPILRLTALMLLGLLGLAACGHAAGDEPLGYLAKTKNRIVFVEWITSTASPAGPQKLSGLATLALVDREAYALHADAAAFTGTLTGSSVALTLTKPLDASTAWTGTLAAGKLTLTYTDATGKTVTLPMVQASRDAFNTAIVTQQQALAGLRTNVASGSEEDKSKAAVDKWSKIVTDDLERLAADSDAVTRAVDSVTAATNAANANRASAHHYLIEAKKWKYAPQVCPLADQSSAAANASSSNAASASAGDANVTRLSGVVKRDISNLTDHHGRLAEAQAAISSYKPKGVPTDKAVNSAISSANKAIADAQHTSNGASRSAGTKASTAQGYASQAQAACASAPSSKPSPSP